MSATQPSRCTQAVRGHSGAVHASSVRTYSGECVLTDTWRCLVALPTYLAYVRTARVCAFIQGRAGAGAPCACELRLQCAQSVRKMMTTRRACEGGNCSRLELAWHSLRDAMSRHHTGFCSALPLRTRPFLAGDAWRIVSEHVLFGGQRSFGTTSGDVLRCSA